MANQINIHYVEIKNHKQHLDFYESLLSKEEKDKIKQLYFERDQQCAIISRGMLRCLLSQHINTNPLHIHFRYSQHGKLFLEEKIHFNVSHSKNIIAYAITNHNEIGIDVEYVQPREHWEQIANYNFSEQEKFWIKKTRIDDRLAAFYTCWTCKEAYIKATGKGFRIPLNKFSINLESNKKAKSLHYVDQPNNSLNYSVYTLDILNNYKMAICIKANPNKNLLINIDKITYPLSETV